MSYERIEFLRFAIEHVEKRIALMDQKASILMAIMGGFYVLIVALLKDFVGLFNSGTVLWLNVLLYLFLIIGLILTFIVVYLLLMTIRPRKGIFQKDMQLERMKIKNPIFWFSGGVTNLDYYESTINHLQDQDIYENLKMQHYTSLQLVERKYYYYRQSINFMNKLIIYNSTGVVLFLMYSLIDMLI